MELKTQQFSTITEKRHNYDNCDRHSRHRVYNIKAQRVSYRYKMSIVSVNVMKKYIKSGHKYRLPFLLSSLGETVEGKL